MTNVNVFTMTD